MIRLSLHRQAFNKDIEQHEAIEVNMVMTRTVRSWNTRVLWCLLLICLSACSSTPSLPITPTQSLAIGEGGFLAANPCGPPCFLSITPGVTTESQANELLKTKGLLINCQSFNTEAESGDRGMTCDGLGVSYQRGTDVIASVGFRPSEIITLGEVVQRHGDPSAILVAALGTPEEKPRTSVVLYYDDIKTSLKLPEQKGNSYDVTAATQIEDITYSDEAFYQRDKKYSSRWNGYGVYYEHIP